MSHKQQQQRQFEQRKKELDKREKKIEEREYKHRQQLQEQKKAQQIFERERKELDKLKRKFTSKQPSSVHSLADTKANALKHHLNKAHNDLKKTKQRLENTKSALNNKNQKMRDLKQDNTAKAEQIKFLARQKKSMTKGKKDVYNDRQPKIKHLKAQIANLKNKLKICEQIKHPWPIKDNAETVKDRQEFESKYNDLQYEVDALQQQLKDYINLDPPPIGKAMRKTMLSKLQKERDRINNEIQNNNKLRQKPLHRFNYNDIANKIKQWVLNDVNYNKYIKKTMDVLDSHNLWGKTIIFARMMVQNDFLTFMTYGTFNIIFEELNKYVKANTNDIKSQSAAEIGYLIYQFPLKKLLDKIEKDKIDGNKFINYYKKQNEWIKRITGWDSKECYQIESILFQHQTFNIQKIKKKFDEAEILVNNKVYTLVEKYIESKEEFEELHYQIKSGQNIENFSNFIRNMVDDLIQRDDQNEHMVVELYESIAKCFSFDFNTLVPDRHDEYTLLYNLQKQYDWTCNYCGNYNYCCYISNKKEYNLSKCILCGITQIESVILKLKNHDTFIMIHNQHDDDNMDNESKKNIEMDEIDKLIQSAQKSDLFDISCPNKNNKEPCTAILRLSKYLIRYNRWIKTVYSNNKDNIENTVDVDIATYITDDIYKKTLMECAALNPRINADEQQLLPEILKEGIANIATFLSLTRKQFAIHIQKYSENKIKRAASSELFKLTMNALKTKAQTEAFGEFLSELDSQRIDVDYHHILHSHINLGTKREKEHVLRFFEKTIHFEDSLEKK
eukprot:266535_1